MLSDIYLVAGGTEAAGCALRLIELVDDFQMHLGDFLNDKLSDAIAAFELDRVFCVCVDTDDLDFATVSAINQTGRVHD